MSGGQRGATMIPDRVVARIASRAAGETGETGGVARRMLGVPVGGRRAARTDVDVDGDVVTARIELAVDYPAPVREVARHVREQVRERVEEMTGFTVRQVDVEVGALERTSRPRLAGRSRAEVR
ncbi:Asp23/Gls24 family envelope stress response protein [Actinomadura macrotermitis]|uniref:Asp23/Gls24 family envelope stress response protein n=1 Tax=Actinomadura macrotermitis TaxID=2585200 RepID=A0A7K0BZU3_9ACTN|nr:Asp23/Gls24 family envelope stress response protein [Actinomadura macrotermitis]MQY06707.1 hypothetical protein [Actinomadura macrotermitis]